MPDPEPSHIFSVIVDKPCWEKPTSYWQDLLEPAVVETLRQSKWKHFSEINILLTDDERIQKLNHQYRGLDKPTNVLSFPSLEAGEIKELLIGEPLQTPIILGDVALSYQIVQTECNDQNKSFDHHLIHLVVHGTLHLLGFDHENDDEAAEMESLEIEILSKLMIPNPYNEYLKQDDDNAN